MKPRFYALLLAILVLVAVLCNTLFLDGFAYTNSKNINRVAESYVDTETGVVYYVLRDLRGINRVCMCPRYNANGTLYTEVLYE